MYAIALQSTFHSFVLMDLDPFGSFHSNDFGSASGNVDMELT